VVLLLAAANHDPARFSKPDRLNFARPMPAHLAFGSGPYACSGAQLIRMAVAVATGALLSSADSVELLAAERWIGGFAIRAPAELRVVLHRRLDSRAFGEVPE
jgi:cytochrome P450